MSRPPSLRRACLALAAPALITAAAFLAYARTFDVPLVFDDRHLVEAVELHATRLSPAQLARAALGFPFGRWLARVTFAAGHAVHGLRPFGYHAVNLAIHAATALSFLAVGRLLLERLGLGDAPRRRTAAAIAALLFAVHPVHTMAVTYVIQRMTSLGTLFALAALLVWLRARRSGRLGAGAAVGTLLLWYLAFSCKESFVVLPALVLLVEACSGLELRAAIARRPALWAGGALAALATAVGLLALHGPTLAAEQRVYAEPIGSRLLTQPRVLWHYLSLLALPLPWRLHVDYAWPASTGLLSPPSTLPALLGVVGLAAGAFAARRRAPLVALAVGWFLVALVVEQSVLPIDFAFEHRLYFSTLGLFLLAGWAASALRPLPAAPWAVAVPLAAVLATGTWLRNEVWRDPVRLFADPAAVAPGRARALVNAAVEARRRGRLDEATRMLLEAARLEPGTPEPFANLGNVAAQQGRPEEAERWYREALRRDPGRSDVLYDLGVLLAARGRGEEAADAYRRALAAAPGNSDARVNLALLLAESRGDAVGALALLDETIALDPGSILARVNRALLLADAGRLEGALADARTAVRLAPDDANAQYALAHVHRAAGRLEDARAAASAALRIQPDHPEARALLRSLASGVNATGTPTPR